MEELVWASRNTAFPVQLLVRTLELRPWIIAILHQVAAGFSMLFFNSAIQHLTHFACKRCGRVRFGQELNSPFKHSVVRDGVIRVA